MDGILDFILDLALRSWVFSNMGSVALGGSVISIAATAADTKCHFCCLPSVLPSFPAMPIYRPSLLVLSIYLKIQGLSYMYYLITLRKTVLRLNLNLIACV